MQTTLRRSINLVISCLVILTMVLPNLQVTQVSAQTKSPNSIQREYNAETGKVTMISGKDHQPLFVLGPDASSMSSEEQSLSLVNYFATEFGLANPSTELSLSKINEADNGHVISKYQQVYKGVPVMAGELIVNAGELGELYSMNGEVSPWLSLDTQPVLSIEYAMDEARQGMVKWYGGEIGDYTSTQPSLWIFDEKLLKPSLRPVNLVWRMDVTSTDESAPIRELVLVDAKTGNISLHFNQVDAAWEEAANRNNQPSSLVAPVCTIQNGSDAGDQLFKAYKQYNCGLSSYGVGAGDFNNDGRQDVALSARTGVGFQHTLLVFLQDNNGSLNQPASYSSGNRSEYLAVGDFNNDSLDDIVTLDNFDGTISIFLQKSDGSLDNRITYSTNASPDSIAVGDINNDGLDDVVISHWSNPTIGVFTQKSDGTLNSMVAYPTVSAGYGDIAIDDINNDGLNDVVKMNGQGNTANSLVIHAQNNSQTLDTYTLRTCLSPCVGNGIGVGDVTGDGKADIVMSNGGNGSSAKIAVFAQDVSGILLPSIPYSSKDIPDPVEIADINSDNRLDVIVLHSGWQKVGLYSQENDGTLSAESLYSIPYKSSYYSQDISIGDVNNDGLPDILVADGQGLVVLYRRSVPTSGGYRLTYTSNNGSSLPGQLLCDETLPSCTEGINPHADYAHLYAGGIWDLYHDNYARNSIDNNGMPIISTVNYGNGYANAFWNGSQMVYGDAYGFPLADDVVAHELTHGVTDHESNLFYFYQSGAINESFSDVWGEYYDQTNGLGNDALAVKWLIGEDISGMGAGRSMSNPPTYGDPDKMTSPNYFKSYEDNGGVHTNSGVNNKAVFLMVSGGAFNSKTVTGIGWDKTAAIYYEANTSLLTSGSDYSDLYYALQQACINLTGQVGITAGDCVQVKTALDAVQMNSQPAAGFNPDAATCATGFDFMPIFQDDLESGLGNWNISGKWSDETGYASSGVRMLYGNDYYSSADSSATLASGIALPVSPNLFLRFDHAFAFEFDLQGHYFDGGVLEYSIDNGGSWVDAAQLFVDGQNYKGKILNYLGTTNNLKGRSAFVGESHGYVSSRYNLTSLGGQTVKFRWRFATDDSYNYLGWMVDDVQIYKCGSLVNPTVSSITRMAAELTNAKSLNYTVTFSKMVTGVDKTDFAVATTGGITKSLVSKVTGSGSTYTVTVGTGSGSGTLGLNLIDNDSIKDAGLGPLGGDGTGNGNFSGDTFTVDKTAPTVVSITRLDASPTDLASVNFTVTFSEPVTGVDAKDFKLIGTGSLAKSKPVITAVSGSGTTYTVTATTGTSTAPGTMRLDLMANKTIKDEALNPLTVSYKIGEVYIVDKMPMVVSINRSSSNPTKAVTVKFTVKFSEAVTGVDVSDFQVLTALTGASIVSITGSGTTWVVTVNTGTGSGTLGLNLVDDDTIKDTLGKSLGGDGFDNGSFIGQVYNVR